MRVDMEMLQLDVDAPHARLLLRMKGSNASIKTGALITLGGVLVVGAPPGTGGGKEWGGGRWGAHACVPDARRRTAPPH